MFYHFDISYSFKMDSTFYNDLYLLYKRVTSATHPVCA